MRATKTKHLAGREIRFVPIGSVLPYFGAAIDEAKDGKTRVSPTNVNLHKPFRKIILSAGLSPWQKLIQNLRASCATEWLDLGTPAHVVARWIAHSFKVQNDNYAQGDDHHFDKFNEIHIEKVAQKGRETVKTAEKWCATDQQKIVWRNKKARPKDRAECPGEESNLHVHYGHMNLNHARLPIPPPGLGGEVIFQ